jgi:hypothetical protein
LGNEAGLYAGCVTGALVRDAYLQLIKEAGFTNIKVQKERKIELPDEMLGKYMSANEVENFKREFAGIASITVYGEKPCCETNSNCC